MKHAPMTYVNDSLALTLYPSPRPEMVRGHNMTKMTLTKTGLNITFKLYIYVVRTRADQSFPKRSQDINSTVQICNIHSVQVSYLLNNYHCQ